MVIFIAFGAMLGAALGSFACCQAWRIRYKAEGKKDLGKRSVCLFCGRKLRWFENVPILSWIFLRGRCRGCGEKIGSAEFGSEILGAILGGLVGMKYLDRFMTGEQLWLTVVEIVLVVVIFTTMGIIAIYDGKWGEMPAKLLWVTVALSMIFAGIEIYRGSLGLVDLGISVLLLAGIYYILYKVSKEKWVGGGDWVLCLSISLVLGKPFLALLELALANTLGLLLAVLRKKRGKMIPMGPALVIAGAIIFSFSDFLMNMI